MTSPSNAARKVISTEKGRFSHIDLQYQRGNIFFIILKLLCQLIVKAVDEVGSLTQWMVPGKIANFHAHYHRLELMFGIYSRGLPSKVLACRTCRWGAFVKPVNRRFTHTQYMSTVDVPAIVDIPSLRKALKLSKGGYTTPICIGNKQASFTPKMFSAMQLGIHNLYISSKLGIYPALHICDVIKGNESDVGNIDFSYRLKRVTNFYVLHCFST